jgi:two-component system, NarL family, sensor kinase
LNISEQRRADRRIRQLADRVVLSQEEERARVSRELHDHVCQLLVSVKYRFELATRQVDTGAPDAGPQLREAVGHLAEAIGTVRRISHELRPPLLDDLGLEAALTLLADDFGRRTGLSMRLDLQSSGAPRPASAVALYRIAQEALANVERHAHARVVQIGLRIDERGLQLDITDDGQGFDPARGEAGDGGSGIGLSNMRQRAESQGGTLTIQSSVAGTRVQVRLPHHVTSERAGALEATA